MAVSPWQRRIRRAQELAAQYPFAAEILAFYIHVARFQEDLHRHLSTVLQSPPDSIRLDLSAAELSQLGSRFESFLSLAEAHGPQALAEICNVLRARGRNYCNDLLNACWVEEHTPSAQGYLALAFLQPYAELLRSRTSLRPTLHTHALCPFCNRKPSLGVLRPLGDGAARSLMCSFCLAEWEFRRIVCPACGEENDKKLAVCSAADFDYIRVECCDSCNTYLKTVDLAKNGRAEPLVDELATAPLDLWAKEHGYVKLQSNLLGM